MYPLILFALITLFSLQSCQQPAADKLRKMDMELKNRSTHDLNTENTQARNAEIKQFIQDIENFIKENPQHPEAADWLFRSGELYLTELGEPAVAAPILENVWKQFPKADVAPRALFLAAFLQNNELNHHRKAKELYTEFIQAFPKHELSDDAELELKFMGIPAQNLIPDTVQ